MLAAILLPSMESQDPSGDCMAVVALADHVEEQPLKFKGVPICYQRGGCSMNMIARWRQNFSFVIQLRDLLCEKAKICPSRSV